MPQQHCKVQNRFFCLVSICSCTGVVATFAVFFFFLSLGAFLHFASIFALQPKCYRLGFGIPSSVHFLPGKSLRKEHSRYKNQANGR